MKLNKKDALSKLQDEELCILNDFAHFCNKHNLTWFLDSGTMLGAVRHKGFIPWDDDIDVGMLRPDYDKFISLANEGFNPIDCKINTYENTPGYAEMFAKVTRNGTLFQTNETVSGDCRLGIFIDVFPYDALPCSRRKASKAILSTRRWQYLSYLYRSSSINVPHKGLIGWAEKTLCKIAHPIVRLFFSRERIRTEYLKAVKRASTYALDDKDGYRLISYPYPVAPGFDPSDITPLGKQLFEGKLYPAPKNENRYLEAMYGNWQKIPDEADRKTHMPQKIVFTSGDIFVAE